jgi:hypothetical protein
MALVYFEVDQSEQVLFKVAASDHPFDRWFRQQLLELHGLDGMERLPGPLHEVIFVWQTSSCSLAPQLMAGSPLEVH